MTGMSSCCRKKTKNCAGNTVTGLASPLLGHALLAVLFIATGHWFLIVIVNLGGQYCGWLGFLTGTPQHYGLSANVPDHRLSCRTYTCSWLPAFLYWNMQHHIEHHMFPAVPFYNLPKLRKSHSSNDMPSPRRMGCGPPGKNCWRFIGSSRRIRITPLSRNCRNQLARAPKTPSSKAKPLCRIEVPHQVKPASIPGTDPFTFREPP